MDCQRDEVNREAVVSEALTLLDEVGLDAVSTRQLAKRLGVEQSSLYWYFRTKKDGARLHAGSTPAADLERIRSKMSFLVDSGVPERDARMAMLAAGRFTVGCVLEEQADSGPGSDSDRRAEMPPIHPESAFEAGPSLIVDGLTPRVTP
ncbi:TetR family transcriptional regulator [Streptomyces sp. NPDC001205]